MSIGARGEQARASVGWVEVGMGWVEVGMGVGVAGVTAAVRICGDVREMQPRIVHRGLAPQPEGRYAADGRRAAGRAAQRDGWVRPRAGGGASDAGECRARLHRRRGDNSGRLS